jgi:hypothetical protein
MKPRSKPFGLTIILIRYSAQNTSASAHELQVACPDLRGSGVDGVGL